MKMLRRSVLKSGAVLASSTIGGRSVSASSGSNREGMLCATDSEARALIEEAISAAQEKGAIYADARVTFTDTLSALSRRIVRDQSMAVGVRALFNGYWGFASSPVCTIEEAIRLGRIASLQAIASSFGPNRRMEMSPHKVTSEHYGHWEMPVKEDPFLMAYDEISDYFSGLSTYIHRLAPRKHLHRWIRVGGRFLRQDKGFGSSLGQFCTQRTYRTTGYVAFVLESQESGRSTSIQIDRLTGAGLGFEYFRDQPVREYIREALEEALHEISLPVRPVDVGRFNTLIDAYGMSSLVGSCFGTATQLDRILGYEANGGGTSYIDDPAAMIGSLAIGSDIVNVDVNRSETAGLATVRWDDEGVIPVRTRIINKGILNGVQTGREVAGIARDLIYKNISPPHSNGCMYTSDAIHAPIVHSGNISMDPSHQDDNIDSLRESMGEGIEFSFPNFGTDFQQSTGWGSGLSTYEVKKGKRVAVLANAGCLFRTLELWKGVEALGGKGSIRRYGKAITKGQPEQEGYNTVASVPAIVKDLTIIDNTRKA